MKGANRMKGNFHVRLLEGSMLVTISSYSASPKERRALFLRALLLKTALFFPWYLLTQKGRFCLLTLRLNTSAITVLTTSLRLGDLCFLCVKPSYSTSGIDFLALLPKRKKPLAGITKSCLSCSTKSILPILFLVQFSRSLCFLWALNLLTAI